MVHWNKLTNLKRLHFSLFPFLYSSLGSQSTFHSEQLLDSHHSLVRTARKVFYSDGTHWGLRLWKGQPLNLNLALLAPDPVLLLLPHIASLWCLLSHSSESPELKAVEGTRILARQNLGLLYLLVHGRKTEAKGGTKMWLLYYLSWKQV